MENYNQPMENNDNQAKEKKKAWLLIVIIVFLIIAIVIAWQFTGKQEKPVIDDSAVSKPIPVITPEVKIIEKEIEPTIPEPAIEITPDEPEIDVPIETNLPLLNESDEWLKIKLPEITWRKELLSLIIDEDMIRRFVVFTDNFAQGNIAYEHSPFVLPDNKFKPVNKVIEFESIDQSKTEKKEQQGVWQWNENASKRFGLYVELIRSMDSETLVEWYIELKPLIDEAYSELGYDDDFTDVLQNAITHVLDMELPTSTMELIQPSVMYKFADSELENLSDSDKLLLRLGKENLLVMKSVLLEIHEKLAQNKNGVH